MKKSKIILSAFSILFVITSFILVADAGFYDLDEVNVLYATKFTAKPIDGADYKDTWVADISGDNPKVTVTYGVVELLKKGKVLVTEEFLKVGGDKGSKRFLVTAETSDYYGGRIDKDRQIRSFFWSAKKLEGTTVIKDSTKPIYSATFSRKFDEDGNRYSFYLSFSNDGEDAIENFWRGRETLMYEADVGSIRETGKATARF